MSTQLTVIRERCASYLQVETELKDSVPTDWLSAAELEIYQGLTSVRRRRHWLAGRHLAKSLVREVWSEKFGAEAPLHLSEICILSRDGQDRSVRPLVLVRGSLLAWTLSLTHGKELAAAVLQLADNVRLGLDLADYVGLSGSLARTWFTAREQAWVEQQPALASGGQELVHSIAAIWAAKEAAYKALNEGESFAPLRIEIQPVAGADWHATWTLPNERRECRVNIQPLPSHVRALATAGIVECEPRQRG